MKIWHIYKKILKGAKMYRPKPKILILSGLLILFCLPCVQEKGAHSFLARRAKRPAVIGWDILPDSSDSEFRTFEWGEIESDLESHNYYWPLLSEDARQEVRRRVEMLLGNSFVEKFLEWFITTCPGAITGKHPRQGDELASVEEVKSRIFSIILKGSYLWGFKTQKPGEEYRPYDLDLIIIVKDSDVFWKKANLNRELTIEEKEFLFGENNPRAPPKISVILIGENAIKRLCSLSASIEPPRLKMTILNLVSTWGAGITLAGTQLRIETPPPSIWHMSIKDIVKNAYRIETERLKPSQLTLEERQELQRLREASFLEEGEEDTLRALQSKYEEEMKWHFRLMKRILEANARILYFEEQTGIRLSNNFVYLNNPFLGRKAIETLNQMINYGVTDITQNFFTSLQTREKMLEALNYLNDWVVRLEIELRSRSLPVFSPGSPREEVTP
ncbi:MAG: hypothetical protein DRP73_04125 [Candidatus Omnitrophota bacterium]|nr:MAG: hypothetical protein DRP73_04125 [Candidatus Omnitrophota bacterium]